MNAITDNHAPVPFHDGLFEWPGLAGAAPRLIASRCPSCKRHGFPAKHFCPYCQAGSQEKAFLSGRGRIYACSLVELPPKLIGKPYVAAYVDLEERVRLFAQIQDATEEKLKVGDPVTVAFRPLRVDAEGRELIAYTFIPTTETTE